MNTAEPTYQRLNTLQLGALVVGVIGIVLGIVGAVVLGTAQFFQTYLFSFLFWMDLSVGCLALYLTHTLVNGRFGYPMRRFWAAGARVIPLMALLFIPVLIGMGFIYPWAGPEAAELSFNAGWLNVPYFIVRAVIYVVVWIAVAYFATNTGYETDTNPDPAVVKRMRLISAFGMGLLVLTFSLAAVDWAMSLDPDWMSSLFGWWTLGRAFLAAFSFGLVVLAIFWNSEAISPLLTKGTQTDLGALLLVFLMVNIYMSFVQFFIIWSANLASKAAWYVDRLETSWNGLYMALIVVHFVALLILLVPGLKKNRGILIGVALVLFLARIFEAFWVVAPTYSTGLGFTWLDIVLPIGIGGIWVAAFAFLLKRQSITADNLLMLMNAVDEEGADVYEETARLT